MKRVISIILVILLIFQTAGAFADGFSTDADAINAAAQSVLMLQVYDADDKEIATGSGFVLFNNRTIVTNYHVITDAKYIIANADDGEQYYVNKVYITDEDKDIAILGFISPTALVPLTTGEDDPVKRAEPVVAIGSPIGITNTISTGIISAVYEMNDVDWIQTTAPISHGSSGGALFNDEGHIIGMTSAYYEDAQNINLAIYISEIINLYDKCDKKTTVGLADFLNDKKSATAEELFNEGLNYMYGKNGVEKDHAKAFDCFLRLYDLNDTYREEAAICLGDAYFYAYGVEKDYQKALYYYKIAADKNFYYAADKLALMYFWNDYGIETNYERAFQYALVGAEGERLTSLQILSTSYRYGYGTKKNPQKAIEVLNKLIEVDKDKAATYMWNLGEIYRRDLDNFTTARSWYRKAANDGSAGGWAGLGLCFLYEDKEQKQAKEYFERALKLDENCSSAMLGLGIMTYYGIETKKSTKQGKAWLQKAADLGNSEAYALLIGIESGILE